MEYDVWFSRFEDELYFTVARHNEAPEIPPRVVSSVALALGRMRLKNRKIAQVGILPPDMIGLDVEV